MIEYKITITEDEHNVSIKGHANGASATPMEIEVATRIAHMLKDCQPDGCDHDPAPKITTIVREK